MAMTMQRNERFRAIEAELPAALKGSEFLLFFQPVVDLSAKVVRGYEALLRWDSPRLGWVEPAEFIPVAEAAGSIFAIGSWVLGRSCAQASRWPRGEVGVNLSKAELLHPLLSATVEGALALSALPAERLALEIAESTYFEIRAEALQTLGELRERGVRIVIDEATGATPAAAGNAPLPIDGLKIARELVAEIGSILCKPADLEAVRRLADWGGERGLTVVGTGIENEAQYAFIQNCGAELGQGFYFGRPLPADPSARAGLELER
jgi:EAL domain-containing protein (putative c-di-GMP-specific phosphodiesterase class I)